mmetsp:Transcript_22486/g.56832  ORF Transcript_22486/g.56832 Transcript_22486/m.56832 type:complete len:738 (-) Transcript_22486:770-2983(-)|eukprot:CAMPEP_0179003040 /NCGR_PEP_ID=MMETSP0795-20121207/12416_1 /TAXON_ID=88552 /ORGANISM="Amoebophrya sp., Strain Ameob2" /LENGTH=737 /DNA_ID=CAMNT_0020696923 /DNA_START=167 /DNA_END=2380 /DNA_ORIENTATION=-
MKDVKDEYIVPAVEGEAAPAGRKGRTTATIDEQDVRIPVVFRNLSYEVQVEKSDANPSGTMRILDSMTGHFEPGRLTALMGPSGSGKTTLMDLLANRKTMSKATVQGDILYAGLPIQRETLAMVSGYVEQFDTLAGELTVRQMLLYTAELKLPRTVSAFEKEKLVDSVIRKLSLENCKDTVIGSVLQRGISGGQAKRVNIAMALITRPAVLYLDEPTSGLDSYTANEVVLLLKSLAQEGRTVVCTIHSPTALAFSLFDDLIMMRDGKVIYHGELAKAQKYFDKVLVNGGAGEGGDGVPPVALQLPDDPTASPVNNARSITRDSSDSKGGPKKIDLGLFSLPEWLVDVTSGQASQTSWDPSNANNALGRALFAEDTAASRSRSKEMLNGGSAAAAGAAGAGQAEAAGGRLDPNDVDLFAAYQQSALCRKVVERTDELAKHDPADDRVAHITALYNPPTSLSKLKTLLKYRMRAHYKDGEFLGPRIGDKIFMGFILLTLYWDIGSKNDAQSIISTAAMLYFICAMCGYGAAAFVPSLTLDRPLYYRETADGCYGPLTYYASKFVEESILCTLTSCILMVPVYYGCSLNGSLLLLVLLYYTTAMVGIVLAYLCAAVCPTIDAANALLPTYVTVCMYFGGLFIIFSKIPDGWYWFSWVSFLRYSWGAIMVNNYQDDSLNEPGKAAVFFDKAGAPVTVLDFYDLNEGVMEDAWACWGIVVAQLAFFSVLGAFAIKNIRHGNR